MPETNFIQTVQEDHPVEESLEQVPEGYARTKSKISKTDYREKMASAKVIRQEQACWCEENAVRGWVQAGSVTEPDHWETMANSPILYVWGLKQESKLCFKRSFLLFPENIKNMYLYTRPFH